MRVGVGNDSNKGRPFRLASSFPFWNGILSSSETVPFRLSLWWSRLCRPLQTADYSTISFENDEFTNFQDSTQYVRVFMVAILYKLVLDPSKAISVMKVPGESDSSWFKSNDDKSV
jgi:hypothetical protein